MVRSLILCLVWLQIQWSEKSSIRRNFCGAMQIKARSGCHVATSPRRDVTKSRRRVNSAEVNNSATSRRHHVATSQRRDVTTSRRHNVATSPRRDVSSKFCISSFNEGRARNLGHREVYDERHGIPEQSSTVFERVTGICTAFHYFWIFLDIMMMFLILDILFFSFMMF